MNWLRECTLPFQGRKYNFQSRQDMYFTFFILNTNRTAKRVGRGMQERKAGRKELGN